LHGPGDFLYVSFIFFFGLFALLLMSHIMGKDRGEKKFLVELHRDEKNPIRQGFLKGNFNFTMVVATLILAFFGSYAYLHKNHPIILKKPLSEFPEVVDSWIGQDLEHKVRYFVSSSDNVSLHRVYRNNQYGKAIELHMIYFPMQDRNNKVIYFPPDSLYSLAKEVQIPVENEMVKVRKAIIQEEGKNKGVLFWWDVNGRVIADRFQTKLATILDSLLNRETNAGLVFVITNTSDGDDPYNKMVEKVEEEFIRDFIPLTREYLNPAR
jgi:EpsI family protein